MSETRGRESHKLVLFVCLFVFVCVCSFYLIIEYNLEFSACQKNQPMM